MEPVQAQGTLARRLGKGAAIVVVFAALTYALPALIDWINPPALVTPFGIHHYSWMFTFVVSGIALILLAMALLRGMGPVTALRELGFLPVAVRPIALGLAAVATMAAVLALSHQPFGVDSVAGLIFLGIAGPVFEELLFRGFAFRGLRRWAGAPFWLAALISSLMFGAAHFGQGGTLTENLMVMGIAAAGGVLFCWAAERWQSLWLGIALHVGMNVVWELFSVGNNAVGGLAGNVARGAAIAAAIGGTLVLTRRQSLASRA